MNQEITVEVQFFLISVLWGGIILLAYDGLRIIRRLINHGTFFLAFEDLIFWVTASVFVFSMIYRQNSGIIRGFSVMGMTIGMVLYHYIFKNSVVEIIVKGIRILLRPFALVIKTVKKGIHFIISKVKKSARFLIRQLKKLFKSVKITVNKRKKPNHKGNEIQTEPVMRKEPIPKFERINLEEIRRKSEALQKVEPNFKPGSAKLTSSKHRIEIKK